MGLNNPPPDSDTTDHGALTGPADDDHSQYALLAGRSGGQEIVGGLGATDDLELKSTRNVLVGDVSGGDYTEIEPDGTIEFRGDAVVWDDLRVPVTSTRKGGNDPNFAQLVDDGSGSRGVFVEWFDFNSEEELFFTAQTPHGWKEGSVLRPHIHWTPKTNGGAGQKVSWGLEYTWVDRGQETGNTVIAYNNNTIQGDSVLLANKHYTTELGDISGVGYSIFSMLICRIFRDAAGTGETDDYGSDAGLLEVDFHYEIDTVGSRVAWSK